MVNQINKNDSTVFQNLKLFFSKSSTIFSDNQNGIQTKLISQSYIQDVLISLIGHQKLIRNSTNKFWVYDNFIYRTLNDFVHNDFFLNKIAEIKEYCTILGSQFLKFDPLFKNIIFLPLTQQKIIYESAITQVIDNSNEKELYLFDTNGTISFDYYHRFPNHFENALLLVLFERLDTVSKLLHLTTKSSGNNLIHFTNTANFFSTKESNSVPSSN